MSTKYVDDKCACSDDETEDTEDTSDETSTEDDSHDEDDTRMAYVRSVNEKARQDEQMTRLDIRRLKKRTNRIESDEGSNEQKKREEEQRTRDIEDALEQEMDKEEYEADQAVYAEQAMPRNASKKAMPRNASKKAMPRNASKQAMPRNASEQAMPRNASEQAMPRNASKKAMPRNASEQAMPRNASKKVMPRKASEQVMPHKASEQAMPRNASEQAAPQIVQPASRHKTSVRQAPAVRHPPRYHADKCKDNSKCEEDLIYMELVLEGDKLSATRVDMICCGPTRPLFLSHAVGCGLCIVGEFRAESEDDRLFWKTQTQAIIDNVGADLKKKELTEALTAMIEITRERLLEISK
jgi:hypothetical protein